MKGLREKYEQHHKLHITDEALEAAVSLSARYINDRCHYQDGSELCGFGAHSRTEEIDGVVGYTDGQIECRQDKKENQDAKVEEIHKTNV